MLIQTLINLPYITASFTWHILSSVPCRSICGLKTWMLPLFSVFQVVGAKLSNIRYVAGCLTLVCSHNYVCLPLE